MKRSEAESILVDKMFEAGLSGFNSREDFVKFFLKAAEEIGMLPPSYMALMRDGTRFIKGENEGDVMSSREWEPEDDYEFDSIEQIYAYEMLAKDDDEG